MTHTPIKTLCLCIALGTLAVQPQAVTAQDYPQRPVRLIVGFPPGGTSDIIGRLVAGRLTESLKQQVVVDNRPGASGLIAGAIVAKSQPDGYTLLQSGSSAPITVSLYAKPPYDVQKDVMPIAHLARTPYLLVVHPSVAARTLSDFVAYAKGRAGKVSYGASASGTVHHLSGEMLKRQLGFEMQFVPYKGTGNMLPDLLGGRLQAAIDNVLALTQHVKSGAIRPIAVTTIKRTAMLPDVPTIAESGVPGFDTSGWFGYYCAMKTPPHVIARLERDIMAIGKDPESREKLQSIGADPVFGPSEELRQMLAREVVLWRKVIQDIGLKVE
jgi:tripartite-type tricarboxylate transporter receptor subunit TctC